MDSENSRFEYDIQKRARAGTSATLRACVSLYLIYLGYQMIRNARDGLTTMSLGLSCVFAGLMFLVALGFGWYIFKRYRRDLEAARISPVEGQNDEDSPEKPDNPDE